MRAARSLLAAALLVPLLSGARTAQSSDVVLTVGGEVATPLALTAADLRALPRRTVRAGDHGAPPATYEGVVLGEVLRQAGAPAGAGLRGKQLALYVLVEAADGYAATFALPELDSAYTDRVVLLADRVDGAPLPAAAGPLRLVVPDEKRHGRWVRRVRAVRVLRAPAR